MDWGQTYGQFRSSYDIEVDKDVPLNARLSGTLVIERDIQIVSEIRRLTIHPEGFTQPSTDRRPVRVSEKFFGLTHQSITHTQYKARIKEWPTRQRGEIAFFMATLQGPMSR